MWPWRRQKVLKQRGYAKIIYVPLLKNALYLHIALHLSWNYHHTATLFHCACMHTQVHTQRRGHNITFSLFVPSTDSLLCQLCCQRPGCRWRGKDNVCTNVMGALQKFQSKDNLIRKFWERSVYAFLLLSNLKKTSTTLEQKHQNQRS